MSRGWIHPVPNLCTLCTEPLTVSKIHGQFALHLFSITNTDLLVGAVEIRP